MSVRFGIFDSFDLGVSDPGDVLRERLAFAVRAEELGIDHYHVTEHHGTPLSVCPSPNIFLSALTQRTRTMRLGALVYVLPAYDPLRLAEEIGALDQLSDGRLDVGIGSGVSPYELTQLGVEPTRARELCAETLQALREGMRNGCLHHRGALVRDIDAELSILPMQRPHPPLWYVSSNARSAQWAGQNGICFVGRWNEGAFVAAAETFRAAARAADLAAAPLLGTHASVYIGDTDDEAHERFRTAAEVFSRQLVHLWHEHGDHAVDALTDSTAAIRRGNALVGSVSTVRDALLAQVEQASTTYFEATLWFGDLTRDEAEANLDAFAHEIVPAVRERAGS